jgi:hypothetical protein
MPGCKTQENETNVENFLQSIEDEVKRKDSQAIVEIMRQMTQEEPEMWGGSIIGFGQYHYIYASGHEGDAPKVGFSPRKQNLTLYLTYGFEENRDLMEKLGKYKTGKACLYVKRLSDVDVDILRELIKRSYET